MMGENHMVEKRSWQISVIEVDVKRGSMSYSRTARSQDLFVILLECNDQVFEREIVTNSYSKKC